jgi:hypothetical protein
VTPSSRGSPIPPLASRSPCRQSAVSFQPSLAQRRPSLRVAPGIAESAHAIVPANGEGEKRLCGLGRSNPKRMGSRSSVPKARAHSLGRGLSHGMHGRYQRTIDFHGRSGIMGSAQDLAEQSSSWKGLPLGGRMRGSERYALCCSPPPSNAHPSTTSSIHYYLRDAGTGPASVRRYRGSGGRAEACTSPVPARFQRTLRD